MKPDEQTTRRDPGVHLVGSVPLPDTETVFRTVAGALGPHLRRLPDGETGERRRWIFFQSVMLKNHPAMESDPTVYSTMNGPTEFTVVGTIRDFDITDRLEEIEVPVLLISGQYDEVRPHVVEAVHDRLRDSEWLLFEDSSHMPHVEERERFLEVVERFLLRVERG